MGTHLRQTSSSSFFTMQKLLAVTLLACLAVARSEITCDECKGFVGNMQEFYLDQDTLGQQTELLVSKICPEEEDAKACEVLARGTWHYIGTVLYREYLQPSSLCGRMGLCSADLKATDASCQECQDSVNTVAAAMTEEDSVKEVMDFLKGEGFCQTTAHPDTCAAMTEQYIPRVLAILAQDMKDTAKQNCCIFSNSNVCC